MGAPGAQAHDIALSIGLYIPKTGRLEPGQKGLATLGFAERRRGDFGQGDNIGHGLIVGI